MPSHRYLYLIYVETSVVDPDKDPHGSALISLSWIRNRISVGNADLDPDPGAWKSTKDNK